MSIDAATGLRSVRTEDHEAFRDSVRRFVAAEVVPNLETWRHRKAMSREVVRAAGKAGFLGIAVPEEFGGDETEDPGFLAVLIEETIDAGATGLALLWALHIGVTIPCLVEHAGNTERRRWLPGLADGTSIGIPFPGSPSGLSGATLRGVPCGAVADLILVTSSDGAVALPRNLAQVHVSPVIDPLAAPEAASADISVGQVGLGEPMPASAADTVHRGVDLWLSVLALSGARRSLKLAFEYSQGRKVFGKPLAEFENTQMRLSELFSELVSATKFVDHCLTASATQTLTAADAAAARYITTSLHDRSVDQSLQLHGGYGYMREYPISQAYADARFLRVAGSLYSDPRRRVAEGMSLLECP